MSATGLLYRSLQSPTSVTAACCIRTADGQVVLQLQDTRLTCWRAGTDGLEQTASWRAPASMLQMVHLPGNYLLILAEGGRCYLHAWQDACGSVGAAAPPLLAQEQLQVPVDSSASQVQPYGCILSTNVLTAAAGHGTASLAAVAYLPGVLHVIKAAPAVAHSTQGASSSGCTSPPDGTMQLQAKAMALTHVLLSCHYPGGEPPALAAVRVSSRVLALAWLSAEEQQLDLQGRSLLAVLHEITVGSQPPVVNVDCVAVDWVQGSISQGPWSLRNVHPTTRLLQPFRGSDCLPPGILAISSRGVLLCTCLGSSLQQQREQPPQQQRNDPQQGSSSHTAAQAHGPSAAGSGMQGTVGSKLLGDGFCARQVQVAQWALPGLPLSCVALPGSSFIVGDSRAGLHLLQLLGASSSSTSAPAVQLRPSGCLAIPDVLLHVPLDTPQHSQQLCNTEQQQLLGLLVLGSKCSSSQVVGLPHPLVQALHSRQLVFEQQRQQEQAVVLPILQSALQPSLAGAQAVAVYQDPSGALPEQQLLVACGLAPRGKLAAVRSGCGLLPAMLDGPELPGDAQLFAIPQPQPCSHKQPHQQPQRGPAQHSMLGFSFPSAGASSVMSLEGDTFRQMQPSGLDHAEASLLMTTAPGGWMLQVTSGGVRVLDASADWQLCSQWRTPAGSSVSLAAACGSSLVVACGAQLTCLAVSCCSGALEVVATAELQQQASALTVFALQGGELMVAAGLWVDNTVLLMTLPAQAAGSTAAPAQPVQLQQACTVELHAEQPRSIALLPVGSADVLLVGGNTGKVLLWEVTVPRQQQQGSICLQHLRSVQISNTSVSLQQSWLPAVSRQSSGSDICSSIQEQRPAAPCVIAHAGAMVVFRANAALLNAVQLQPSSSGAAAAAAAAAASGLSGCVSATACVEVSRLCGSEACLGAAPVHTPGMPHSLAWVSAAHRLCFGSIAPEHKLRWRSCGLAGTPLAMAVHQASDTIIVLLAANDFEAESGSCSRSFGGQQHAQQRLVVLDARSLRVLMQLALAPGHTYTMLHVLDLPATSQQQDQQQGSGVQGSGAGGAQCGSSSAGGGAAAAARADSGSASGQGQGQLGCLPFIVLGSHAVLAAAVASPVAGRNPPAAGNAAAAPMVKRVGLLSIFELRHAVVQGQAAPQSAPLQQQQDGAARTAAGSELRYELVLHGMVPLQVTPCSACTVVPQLLQPTQHQQQSGVQAAAGRSNAAAAAVHPRWLPVAAAAAQQQPLLLVGSERGMTLLRVVVDDAAVADKHMLEQLMGQVGQVSQSSDASPLAAAAEQQHQQQQGPAASAQGVQGAAQRAQTRRSGRVSVQELSSAAPLFQGVVTKLSSCGNSIMALESMGPVAAFQALCVQDGGWVQLLGVGMDDRSKLMAVDFIQAAPQQHGPSTATDTSRTASAIAAGPGSSATAVTISTAGGGDSGEEQRPQHAAVLVAAHPAGLVLLQRDLQQETSHVTGMLQAAQAAWEAGQRPPDIGGQHRSILMVEPAVANTPWQGAGEAAPWAVGRLEGAAARAAAPGDQQGEQQAAAMLLLQQQLAAAAEAAAGVAQAAELQCVRPDWLSLMNPSPGLAPVMLPSAACAPAPGSMLLCQARLGLHTVPAQTVHSSSLDGYTSGQAGGMERIMEVLDGPVADNVLCLSSSGGIAAAQLLPPAPHMAELLPWQVLAVLEPQAAGQLLLWGLGASGGAAAAATLVGAGLPGSGSFVAKEYLRGLTEPDPVSSYEGYERAAGALASAEVGRLVLPEQQPLHDIGRQEAPLGVVDGDLLDMVVARQQGQGAGGMQAAAALQHSLWQQAL